MQVLGMCLPYEKVFSEAPVKYFFRAQITQIFLFLGMLVWERSKAAV